MLCLSKKDSPFYLSKKIRPIRVVDWVGLIHCVTGFVCHVTDKPNIYMTLNCGVESYRVFYFYFRKTYLV